MRKKIGIIVQRYGKQINGGAESHARMIAERLSEQFDITVFTSCAINYHSWESELPPGESYEENIRILRFKSDKKLTKKEDEYISRKIRERHLPQKLYRWLGKPSWWYKLFPEAEVKDEDHFKWLVTQGPFTPDLIEYIKQYQQNYIAFVFFTAVYYPAAMGILTVPQKSILVPLMHDEPAAYFEVFKIVMSKVKWILFNTLAEQRFCENLFPIQHAKKKVVAVGIDLPDAYIDTNVLTAFHILQPYIIYIGRVDTYKGCNTLIQYFSEFKLRTNSTLQLVLVGNNMMNIVSTNSIIVTGFVTDKEKEQLLKQAEALIIPSHFESLSLALLESFACKVPVIANGKTEVLKDHINESGGGWCYDNEKDFFSILTSVTTNTFQNKQKGEKGLEYIKSNYSWKGVIESYMEAIHDIESITNKDMNVLPQTNN